MSQAAQSWVWQHSKARGPALLVLLAIGDYAHDDGTSAHPKIETLAAKARVSVASVKRHVDHLRTIKELEVRHQYREDGTQRENEYVLVGLAAQSELAGQLNLSPPAEQPKHRKAQVARPAQSEPPGSSTVSPQEPTTRNQPAKAGGRPARPRAPRARDPILDTLARVDGVTDLQKVTRSLWASLATAKRDLLEVEPEVSAAEVWKRGQRMRRAWGDRTTAHALVKHWHRFGAEAEVNGQTISYGGGER